MYIIFVQTKAQILPLFVCGRYYPIGTKWLVSKKSCIKIFHGDCVVQLKEIWNNIRYVKTITKNDVMKLKVD